jgi:type IV pilus assembly protein PilX
MNSCSRIHRPCSRGAAIVLAQRGITLPIVLLFLLIITIAVSFGIRRATLSEGITRNQLDYEVSRQAAEAALQDAERDLRLVLPNSSKPAGAVCARNDERPLVYRTGAPWFDTVCPRGQCRYPLAYYNASDYTASPVVNPQPWWPETGGKGGKWNSDAVDPKTSCTFNGAVPLGTFTGTPAIKGVARQPEYLIEYMARGDDVVMRITARGFGFDVNTETVLQSYFRPL